MNGTKNSSDSYLSPCSCKGTLKFAHRKCLKKWILKKIGSNKEKVSEVQC